MTSKPPLTRARAIELLDRLNAELGKTGATAELYVVGGAAMMLEYDGGRRTVDIDDTVQENAFDVQAAAEAISKDESDIDIDWLNDHAYHMGYLPTASDEEARNSYQGTHPKVQCASPKRMLAMKMYAGRKEDASDLMKLMTLTGVSTMDEAMKVFESAFPGTELPEPAESW